MLTCIACTKQLNSNNTTGVNHEKQQHEDEDGVAATPRTKQAVKSLTSQIKNMAVKASTAYMNCRTRSGSSNQNQNRNYAASDSKRFHFACRRAGEVNSMPRIWGKEMEERLKVLYSGEGTPATLSGRTTGTIVFVEEDEPMEWVAQVEPGILITFVSLPRGGNDLKRIRFSRDMFEKWQAQRWWEENFEKVMELYNVRQSYLHFAPLRTLPRSGNKGSRIEHAKGSLVERKFSSISGAKTEASSMDGSVRCSLSREAGGSGELSASNASDMETEWVEQDKPGVYITIRQCSNGTRELRRIRFSRERFGEMNARLWWEQNRARIQHQYL